MFPTYCNLYISPVQMDHVIDENINFWDNVHGFNFRYLKRHAGHIMCSAPRIEQLHLNSVLAEKQNVIF